MPALFRMYGDFDLDAACDLFGTEPDVVLSKHELNRAGVPRGISSMHYQISDKDYFNLELQISDAISFFKANYNNIAQLMSAGVTECIVDFSVGIRSAFASQGFKIHHDLLNTISNLNIHVVMSVSLIDDQIS